jgi:hypothetical protein
MGNFGEFWEIAEQSRGLCRGRWVRFADFALGMGGKLAIARL